MKKINRLPSIPKDMRTAALDMSVREARFMVEDFYRWVGIAQASKDHRRILEKEKLTNYSVGFMAKQVRNMRDQYRSFLDVWSEQYPAAKWAKSIRGVGPVIAAGLAAFIDTDKAKSISSIWRYAGLDPHSRPMTLAEVDMLIQLAMDQFGTDISEKHVVWIAGKIGKDPGKLLAFSRSKKRGLTWPKLSRAVRWPSYNTTVKRVVISAGNCFIKHPSMYHDLYVHRKLYETDINENGGYKKRAKRQFERYNYQPGTGAYECYSQGLLPESHIIASAKRWATKIFLAHYYMVEYYIRYEKTPPDVYALDILKGHRKIHIPGEY